MGSEMCIRDSHSHSPSIIASKQQANLNTSHLSAPAARFQTARRPRWVRLHNRETCCAHYSNIILVASNTAPTLGTTSLFWKAQRPLGVHRLGCESCSVRCWYNVLAANDTASLSAAAFWLSNTRGAAFGYNCLTAEHATPTWRTDSWLDSARAPPLLLPLGCNASNPLCLDATSCL